MHTHTHIHVQTHTHTHNTAPDDYAHSTESDAFYTFTSGMTSLDISVSTVNDGEFEDTKQFQGLLSTI